MHAELCPVCNGEGKIESEYKPLVEPKECHGCKGKGWIEVQDSQTIWYVPQPYQPYVPYQPQPWESPWIYTNDTADQIPPPDYQIWC